MDFEKKTLKEALVDASPIFLIGYMACGKTTFGRALARRLNRRFIDLDFYIEQRFRLTIREIFERYGEMEFRRMEKEMLRETGSFYDVVVACGGGTPCYNDNMDYMLSSGLVVWLEASVDRITERLIINSSRRPLMAGKSPSEIRETVMAGLSCRDDDYARAHIRFSGERLENRNQIEDTINKFLESETTS